MDRGDMVSFFAEHLEGFEPGGLVRCWGNRYYRRPRIVGPVRRARSLTVERWGESQALASRPVKAVLTGPYTLMHWSFDEHYPAREACCEALAEALRLEAQELVAAGARELQLDEPAIGSRPEELGLAQAALSAVTSGVRGRARIWVHVAYGELRPIVHRLWELPADGLLLELANSRFELLDALDGFPQDKLLGAGVIDALRPEVESPGEVRRQVERLLRYVPPQRLWLNPDAGLRGLPEDVAEAKLRALRAAALSFS
jgi:5-methyltetrahydropteroyltriglutamate--homocysteine methyltransferase